VSPSVESGVVGARKGGTLHFSISYFDYQVVRSLDVNEIE